MKIYPGSPFGNNAAMGSSTGRTSKNYGKSRRCIRKILSRDFVKVND